MIIPPGSEWEAQLLDELYAREHFDDYYEPVYQDGELVMWRPKRGGVREARLKAEEGIGDGCSTD